MIGKLKNGAYLACLTNVGIDLLKGFKLGYSKKFTRCEYLTKDGKWKHLDAHFISDREISVNLIAETYEPIVMRFWEK